MSYAFLYSLDFSFFICFLFLFNRYFYFLLTFLIFNQLRQDSYCMGHWRKKGTHVRTHLSQVNWSIYVFSSLRGIALINETWIVFLFHSETVTGLFFLEGTNKLVSCDDKSIVIWDMAADRTEVWWAKGILYVYMCVCVCVAHSHECELLFVCNGFLKWLI